MNERLGKIFDNLLKEENHFLHKQIGVLCRDVRRQVRGELGNPLRDRELPMMTQGEIYGPPFRIIYSEMHEAPYE